MQTVKIEIFEFDELSEPAKQKARDWYREASAGDNYFAESVIEDAGTIAATLGIELKNTVTLTGSKQRQEPAIYWSGFSSQGDGASFEGVYIYKPGALAKIKAHAPKDSRLHTIAEDLQAVQKRYGYRLSAVIKTCGQYSHSGTMQIEVGYNAGTGRDVEPGAIGTLQESLRGFADWIYAQLEQEYYYHSADAQVDESIRANEYEFLASGKRASFA